MTLGEIGYLAYSEAAGGKGWFGNPLPEWSTLPGDLRAMCCAAADAVVEAAKHLEVSDATGDPSTQDDPVAICECGHAGALHDIETMTAQRPRCCVDGCGCGSGG